MSIKIGDKEISVGLEGFLSLLRITWLKFVIIIIAGLCLAFGGGYLGENSGYGFTLTSYQESQIEIRAYMVSQGQVDDDPSWEPVIALGNIPADQIDYYNFIGVVLVSVGFMLAFLVTRGSRSSSEEKDFKQDFSLMVMMGAVVVASFQLMKIYTIAFFSDQLDYAMQMGWLCHELVILSVGLCIAAFTFRGVCSAIFDGQSD